MQDQPPFALPLGSYKFKMRDGEKKTSKAGNPMIVCTLELVDNAMVNTKDGPRDPNGLTVTHYVTLTEKSLRGVNEFRRCVGLPTVTVDDLPNEDAGFYKDQVGFAVFRGTAEEMKNTETGELIVNPHTKKPEMTFKRELVRLQLPA